MNKKVTLSLLSATVFASMAASAFAAPTQGVYMGGSVDKFYKLDDLFNLSAAAKKQFVVDLNAANPDLDFKNLVFVDFDGKGAKFSEILAAGTLPKAKRDLTKADFEGSYVTVNLDGSNGVSYDPRNDAVDVPTGDLKVESVSAINAKSLKVDFNTAVEDTTKVSFTVTRDGNPVVLTPTYSEDKKSVTLASTTSLVAGEYTVKVTGAAEGHDSKTVTVAAEKVAKIEFASDKLVKTDANSATTTIKVYNQYNEDITSSALASGLTYVANVATTGLDDDNKGKVTLDATADFTANQKVLVTVLDAATGTTAKAELTVVEAGALKELTFGTVTLPTGKTRVETGLANAAQVAVTAKDSYGNDLTTAAELNAGATIVSSVTGATATFVDVDNKPVLQLDTQNLSTAKSVTITVLIKSTGTPVSYTFDVVTPPAAAEVTLTAPTATIAAGDAANTLVVPVTLKDQFGTVMTADEIVAAAGGITLTSSNSTVIASNQLAIATTGENKGKIVNTAQFGATAGTTTITATVNATGKSSSFTLTTGAARKLASLSIPTTLSSNLIQGASTKFALGYKDQYGKVFDAAADVAGYKVNVAITKVSGDDGGLTIAGAGLAASAGGDVADESAADAANAFTLQAVAGKKGTYTVTAKYINTTTNEVVSQESKTINVVANSSAGITYSVEDIGTLYKDGADFNTADVLETEDVDAGYAKEIKITAKDANGNTYVIPSSAIVSITVDNANTVVDEVDGKWYVAGNLAANPTADASSVLTVVINTNEGIQTITKTVNISKAALVAQEVKLLDAEITDEDAAPVTSLTFADQVELLAGKDVYAYLIDQFGGHSMTFTGSEYVTNNNGFTFTDAVDTFTIAGGKLKLVDADSDTTATAGATARYVFVTSNGKTAAVDIKVTGAVPTP